MTQPAATTTGEKQSRTVRLDSYFSLETDLASELRSLPEFVSGTGYSANLASGQESVVVALMPASEDDRQFVQVQGIGQGGLFEAVLGRVIYAMSAHSDDVWLTRWDSEA
jgi:hypothetical protein